MFDLPVETAKNRKDYRMFRKYLLKEGFIMLEKSVYCRMIPSGNSLRSLKNEVKRHSPPNGMVALLTVTAKQFADMDIITGTWESNTITSMERVIEV